MNRDQKICAAAAKKTLPNFPLLLQKCVSSQRTFRGRAVYSSLASGESEAASPFRSLVFLSVEVLIYYLFVWNFSEAR